MGIKQLNKLLRNNCPQVYEEIHLSEYAYKKVAIDISLYLCKFKIICGASWLSAFINLVACLRRNEIHCIFIYDSGYPPEKEEERKERARQREKNDEKIFLLEEAIKEYYRNSVISPILIEIYNKKTKQPKRLLSLSSNTPFSIKICEDALAKMKSYVLDIRPEDFINTKKLFDILDVPYCNAPLEAETMCADLCIRGEVDAVISEDTDVLAYGTPDFLTKINTGSDTCVRVKYADVLDGLELNSEEFLDVCIMCGCDYNKNIYRVGPEKSYKYIKQYSSIEHIGENTSHDITILNHIRGRELFRGYEKKNIKIGYCGTPDFEALAVFIAQHNVKLDMDFLRKSFTHSNTIVFEETL